MTLDTIKQWIATFPSREDARKVEAELDSYLLLIETLENNWDKPASPYTGWGTEQRRYRLYLICESLKQQGCKVAYNLKASTDELQIWDVIKGSETGTLVWYANTDWFSSTMGHITN